MVTESKILSDLAIPPGEYLEEVLEAAGLSQAELARRMGRPAQAVNEIIKGDKSITPETAIQLEKVVGVFAHIWSSLEAEYRLIKASQIEAEHAKKEETLLAGFPYLELTKLGLVEKTRNPLSKVQSLRRFFGVSSLFNLQGVKEYRPAFRQGVNNGVNHEALAAWLRAGAVLANKIDCKEYDRGILLSKIEGIRALTLKHEPDEFFPVLATILRQCGIALVVIPHFKQTHTTGATFWVKKNKAVIMMSLRGGWADIFWFSLFHELGHVLLHDKRHTFLENGKPSPEWEKQEDEADVFSQKTLIPVNALQEFKNSDDFSATSINTFSRHIGIAPGIVTGRLQHEKIVPYTFHAGRIRYKWK
ncbi:Antitoxin HigA / unknown domain [hydrothermal vent metagenome]|uniref:HTH cro/C1-type domain-containing protein n=1 Tax=hydrothermal vent metagenome TaxID=652676 RepID=A0A3B0ZH73_9ZZZZ